MPIDVENDDVSTALNKLRARENTLNSLASISQIGTWEVDFITHQSIWSDQNYYIYRLNKESTTPTLELFFSLLIPEDLSTAQSLLDLAVVTGKIMTLQAKVNRADGVVIDILLSGQVLYNKENEPIKIIGSTRDITLQMNTQQQSAEFLNLIEHSQSEISIIDYDTFEYLYVNLCACKSLGYSSYELLKMNVYDINPDLTPTIALYIKKTVLQKTKVVSRTQHKRKDGSIYHLQSLIHKIAYQDKAAFVIFDTDITKQVEDEQLFKEQTKQLNHQANHDALTNLPNRMLFQDRLEQTIHSSTRNDEKFALFFLDLDQFKKINDSLGHHIGDYVLIEAASRLQQTLRKQDTLARLGGDEFTIILKNIRGAQNASNIAQKINKIMKEPIIVKGHTLFISSSIGISMFPQDASSSENLIKFADSAMYKAKDEGRDNFQFYSSEMTAIAFERVVMESSLRIAIKEEQFVVYFQPQYNATENTLIGMEALVRWKHPVLGLVPPSKFIPIAEENGLIIEIDHIVMKKAMKQFSQWYEDGFLPGTLALNLAMKQLNQDDFIYQLSQTMKLYNFQAEWLELEVTEGQVMDNPDLSIQKLNEITNMNIEIAIDDFGTGYSSLAYLKKLPLDKLKIDQSFVRYLPDNEDDAAIARAIIALGKSLNLKLIAEGVETPQQRDFLVENGCENIQGYLYSKPLPIEEITVLLQKNPNKT